MPYHIAIALRSDEIAAVTNAIEQVTGASAENRDSLYLGEYDLFRLPEEVQVKYNFVIDDWDYPEHQDYPVLIVAQNTERPDDIEAMASRLGFECKVVEKTMW